MSNASFTRDEVILALDVLYSCGGATPRSDSEEILVLCDLLHRLPIHPEKVRKRDFRTPTGVRAQIYRYERRYANMVGSMFYEIDAEYADKHDELHAIAKAIRKNASFFIDSRFGDITEEDGFPEGTLLGHLHRVIEKRDGEKYEKKHRCDICQISPAELYRNSPDIMAMHLTVPVIELDGTEKYGRSDFITVCPNCHEALHRFRPWLKLENCDAILR